MWTLVMYVKPFMLTPFKNHTQYSNKNSNILKISDIDRIPPKVSIKFAL